MAWSIYTLLDLKDRLNRMLEKAEDPKFRQKIRNDISELECRLMDYDDNDYEDTKLIEQYYDLKELYGDFKHLWPMFSEFDTFANSHYAPELLIVNNAMSKKDLLDLTHDFYKYNFDKPIFHFFMQHFKMRKSHLIFNNNPDIGYQGLSIPITSLNQNYIEINRLNNIEDLFALVHEYMHAIYYSMNRDYNTVSSDFIELSPMFAELVAADYFRKVLKNDNVTAQKAKNYFIYSYQINNICNLIKLFSIEDEEGPFERNKDLYSGAKKLDIIKPQVLELLKQDQYEECASYIMAIELYNLYKNDREQAIKTFKKIIFLQKDDTLDYYKELQRLGIHPNEHLKEFYDRLNKEATIVQRKRQRK